MPYTPPVSGMIDAAIASEVTARNTAISTAVGAEATARNTAISTAVGAEATARDGAIGSAVANRAIILGGVAPVTAAGPTTVAANTIVPTDATSNDVGLTLPAAPADGTRIVVKQIAFGGTYKTTITRGGSDVFNKAGGSTSLTLTLANQSASLQYYAASSIWFVVADDEPLSGLDARFGPLVENVNTVADAGASYTIPDVTTATIHDLTLTAACAITFPTGAAGKSFTLLLRQGGSGSYTVTWSSSPKWSSGAVPVLTTAVNAIDMFEFVYVGTSWKGFTAGIDEK